MQFAEFYQLTNFQATYMYVRATRWHKESYQQLQSNIQPLYR